MMTSSYGLDGADNLQIKVSGFGLQEVTWRQARASMPASHLDLYDRALRRLIEHDNSHGAALEHTTLLATTRNGEPAFIACIKYHLHEQETLWLRASSIPGHLIVDTMGVIEDDAS